MMDLWWLRMALWYQLQVFHALVMFYEHQVHPELLEILVDIKEWVEKQWQNVIVVHASTIHLRRLR